MNKKVEVFDYANHICNALTKGVLLTTAAGGRINTMTIGWGTIGIEWNRPLFVAYIRESRYSSQLLKENPEFTVNFPCGEYDANVLRYCGKTSGKDTDKFKDLGLTAVASEVVSVPGIKEFPLTLECKVVCRQKQNIDSIPQAILARFYHETREDGFRDPHIALYAEIVNAYYIIQE